MLEANGKPAVAVLPYDEYKALLEVGEDADDGAALARFAKRYARGEEEAVPAEVLDRLLAGESPLRVWREHRGMSAAQVAEAMGRFARDLGVAFQSCNALDDWQQDGDKKVSAGGDVLGGRPPVLWDLGLEALGVKTDHGCVVIDELNRTNVAGIYAIGDVVGPHRFTHMAGFQARLVLRNWNPAAAPLAHAASTESYEHLKPWMPWAKESLSLQEQLAYIRRSRSRFDARASFTFGIFNPTETEVWGGCGLHFRQGAGVLEIGYWIHVNQINKGYATELSAALTRVAFTVENARRVEIRCDPANARSARVPEKLGFTPEGTLRQAYLGVNDKPRDVMVWGMLAGEMAQSPVMNFPCTAFDALGRKLF